jgi:hypothetical protein
MTKQDIKPGQIYEYNTKDSGQLWMKIEVVNYDSNIDNCRYYVLESQNTIIFAAGTEHEQVKFSDYATMHVYKLIEQPKAIKLKPRLDLIIE